MQSLRWLASRCRQASAASRLRLLNGKPVRHAMLRFVYSAWFRDTTLVEGDQDREWVACMIILATSAWMLADGVRTWQRAGVATTRPNDSFGLKSVHQRALFMHPQASMTFRSLTLERRYQMLRLAGRVSSMVMQTDVGFASAADHPNG